MADEPIILHDLLLRDWGTGLPISGGSGQSRENPIIVTATDADTVALSQLLTLRGLGRGRGIFWRSISRALLGEQWPGVEQFKIKAVELTDTQVITQTENYYFNVSAMQSAGRTWQSLPLLIHHDVSGLTFPYEIGWMHFDRKLNNEAQAPGLGTTLFYAAPHTRCSIYIYDRGYINIPNDVKDELVKDEFENAHGDITVEHPDYERWPDPPKRNDCLRRFYRVGNEGYDVSLLVLTASRGRFIKARLTWMRDYLIDRLVGESVDSLLGITR
ncbi:MAG: hypothetical protein WCD20_00305 [Rhodomicrobium sp.]